VQALVRPIAEHHALHELIGKRIVPFDMHGVVLESAADFRALLDETPLVPSRVRAAQASASVWREILSKHPDLAVWVAANRTVPAEIIEILTAHPRIQVRAAVASNPELHDDAMIRLAHDKSDLVRMRIACNSQATRDVLAHLVADTCVVVSKHAQARLQHDISGVMLPASYLDEVSMFDLLH
jgi:hypothetical protein